MINFSDFNKKFKINHIYKNDYIKVHTIFNQEFEYFSKTIFSLNKNLILFKDDDIYKSYKKVKEFTGKAGSAFFVDSYGLHKANPPKKKSRIMLNVHFGSGKILYSPNDLILNLK